MFDWLVELNEVSPLELSDAPTNEGNGWQERVIREHDDWTDMLPAIHLLLSSMKANY